MAKYNPKNTQHRAWLASNILDLLVKWGFSIDANYDKDAWEFVCVRTDKFNPTKKIIVYTSIEKVSGAVRDRGNDRVRVVRESVLNGNPHFRRVARINRVGEFKEINKRICEGIIKAQKQL